MTEEIHESGFRNWRFLQSTLGYGDIVPATTTARTIAGLEAVVGQFYVAVIVALLVGMFISTRIVTEKMEGL